MIKFILTATLAGFTILFAALKNVFGAAKYIALGFGCCLALMWSIIWLIEYFLTYSRKGMEDRYKLFCAQIVNSSALTLDLIEKHDKIYYKKFKRTLVKEKIIAWLKIILAFGVTIALILVFL